MKNTDTNSLINKALQVAQELILTQDQDNVLSLGDDFVKICDLLIASTENINKEKLNEFKKIHQEVSNKVESALKITKEELVSNQKHTKGLRTYAKSEINSILSKQKSVLNRKKL